MPALKKKNVTFVLSEDLDTKIEAVAFIEEKEKSAVLIEALELLFQSKNEEYQNILSGVVEMRNKIK